MITNSVLKIYSDKFCQNLYETVTVSGSTLKGRTSTLLPGKAYWATVTVTDDEVGTSPESNPYKFFSLPNIVLSGEAVVTANSFARPTTITTDIVGVVDHGFQVTTDEHWSSRPTVVSGNTVTGLEERTVYYYRPWVKDEFGRVYVNVDDVDFIRTDYSLPLVKITETYTPTDTTFSGKVAVDSTTTVTAVWAETTAGGTTITTNLVAGTGEQDFTVTGLQPFTKYHLVCKATNQAGTGVSQTIYFTTAQQQEQPVGQVEIYQYAVSPVNNNVKAVSVTKYEEGVSLVSHKVYLYDNSEHRGEPLFTYDGEDSDMVSALFDGTDLDEDTTYFMFSSVVLDGGGEPQTEWSEPVEFRTYSLITVSNIVTTTNSVSFDFTVEGYSSDTQIEYSLNGEVWRRVSVEDPQGDSVTITGLSSDTSYYLRARVANTEKEYCSYNNYTFTTEYEPQTVIDITSFTELAGNSIDVNIEITQE